MAGPEGSDPRASRRAALRQATLRLVIGVVTLDAVALGLYYLAGIDHAAQNVRTAFSVCWTVATALVVAVLLRKVRKARHLPLR